MKSRLDHRAFLKYKNYSSCEVRACLWLLLKFLQDSIAESIWLPMQLYICIRDQKGKTRLYACMLHLVKVIRAPMHMQGGTSIVAHIEDPDGYQIELVQRLPG